MKKIFLTILVVASMVSCSNDDVVSIAPRKAITFGNVFIENSTRAAAEDLHTTDKLDKFFVYGTVTGSLGSGNIVNLYKGAEVTKSSGVWDCNVTQYWVPKCLYNFVAISDVTDNTTDGAVVVTDANGMPQEIKYDASSQKDLLYAKIQSPIVTDANADPNSGTDENGNVKFTFEHLLSKVMFTFTNGFDADTDVKLTVEDIKITKAVKTSTYDCTEKKWAEQPTDYFSGDGEDYLFFGSTPTISPADSGESSKNCLLIPGEISYNISFTIKHNKGGNPTGKNITTELIKLEPGHFYNFTTELNVGNVEGVVPIKFNINKSEWGDDEEEEVGPYYPEI